MIHINITKQFKLLPTAEQEVLLTQTAKEYIAVVNDVLDYILAINEIPSLTSASFKAKLPSAVKNECCRAIRSIWRKYCKGTVGRLPVLRKPVITWNNQNYRIGQGCISFPVWKDGKSCRITVKAVIPEELQSFLDTADLGGLRVTRKQGKWIAQVTCDVPGEQKASGGVMGIDLGLKCPAVCTTDSGKVLFVGNGRQNKSVRRRFAAKRKKLQKRKKQKAVKRMDNKEQRFMRDVDHKVSRQIVNFAIANDISIIKMERLSGIRSKVAVSASKSRKPARKSRKNNRYLSSWSFNRLMEYIRYKAFLAGIEVQLVDPAYTSQRCPNCGSLNHADGRQYRCACGYRCHRDLVGARNILAT